MSKEQEKIIATDFLQDATKQLANRATLRDQPEGERSMAAIVRSFNALTGHTLTEAEGWEFMLLLKMVRGRQGKFNADDYTDMAAYASLLGECESTRDREVKRSRIQEDEDLHPTLVYANRKET
jgi:hypothetical protein